MRRRYTPMLVLIACTEKPVDTVDDTGATDTADDVPSDSADTGDDHDSAETAETADTGSPPVALFVNELMSGNTAAVLDDNGVVSDWIELYNAGASDVDLAGYSLSDDWTNPAQHVLPEGTALAAGGYLVLWADGDTTAGDTHLGFKLSQDGEGVGLFDPAGEAVDWVVYGPQVSDTALARIPDGGETWEDVVHGTPGRANARVEVQELVLLASGDIWRYDDSGMDLGTDWRESDYDDADWSSGPSPLGYGDTHGTTLSYGTDANNKHPTTYFRVDLPLAADEAGNAYAGTISLLADDSALVWLNGVEIVRHNLDDGDIAWSDYSNATVSGGDETAWTDFDVDPSLLGADNVLAIEVHQATATSSDLQLDVAFTVSTWAVVE